MTQANRRRNCRLEWQLSDEAWEDAELLLEGGRLRAAVARFYYAAFHAALAGLLSRGLEPRTHCGLKALFSQHFVHAGLLPAGASRVLSRLETEREDADYSREAVFVEEDVRAVRQMTLELREPLVRILRQEGWLGAAGGSAETPRSNG